MLNERCWDELAFWGAPLSTIQEPAVGQENSTLFRAIEEAHASLLNDPDQPDFERKQDAFRALCLALKTHYPDHWQRTGLTVDPSDWPDRMIKLYRIAKARLGVVL